MAAASVSSGKKKRTRKRKATPFADVGRTLGGSLGGLFGYKAPGAALGGLLGGYTGKIFGSGAYSMSRNSLWATGAQVPVMHSSNESVSFRHREYIGDVTTSTAFSIVNTFNVNPGDSICFPYLSGIARNFQEYEFSGLVFEFKSTSADAIVSSGTSTAMGTIALAAQYDLLNAVIFSSKVDMLNEMWAVDGKPSINHFLPIECAPKSSVATKYNVRMNNIVSDSTRNELQDLCRVDIGAVGSPGAYNIGEIYVSYDVTLFKPRKTIPAGLTSTGSYYMFTKTGISGSAPLGVTHANTMGDLVPTITGTSVLMPGNTGGGAYCVTLYWQKATSVTVAFPNLIIENATTIEVDGGNYYNVPDNGVSSPRASLTFTYRVADVTQPAGFSLDTGGTLPTDELWLTMNRVDPSVQPFA